MSKLNNVKSDALGMPIGTAANRLRKMILFSLVCRLELNTCYQCGKEILAVGDLSIEHKEPWLQADDPVTSFFDLDNIAFSHLSCNIAAGVRPTKKYANARERKSAENKRRWARMTPEQRKQDWRKRYERYGY